MSLRLAPLSRLLHRWLQGPDRSHCYCDWCRLQVLKRQAWGHEYAVPDEWGERLVEAGGCRLKGVRVVIGVKEESKP